MKIGITDTFNEDTYPRYVEWLRSVDPTLEVERLSHELDNSGDVSGVDGLLMTGGGDVNPALYGSEELGAHIRGVNDLRDRFEIDVLHRALEADKPIMGVCRGMQITNVYLDGTLHVDLVSDGFNDHASVPGTETRHAITIQPNSLLSDLAGGIDQQVNSYHHQAVDALGRGLVGVAHSPDGVTEAAEWSVKEGMPFLMLVQWHPERADTKDVFSQNLARIFLREVRLSLVNKVTT